MYVTEVKRWTAIFVGVIGVLTAAHALPLMIDNVNGDTTHWNTIAPYLFLCKAVFAGGIAIINALTEESS